MRQKIKHEAKECLVIFLFLAPLFCAFSTYRILLLHQFKAEYFEYGTALFNALALSKIILVGEYVHLGTKQEHRPLIVSVVYKGLAFSLLVAAFRAFEDALKGFLNGQELVNSVSAIGWNELLARSIVIFCALIPFFAFRETGRVLAEDKLFDLFLRKRPTAGWSVKG